MTSIFSFLRKKINKRRFFLILCSLLKWKRILQNSTLKMDKRQFFSNFWSEKCLKGTVVNRTCHSFYFKLRLLSHTLHTITVPLSKKFCLYFANLLRYALICRQCQSHNGMALREEFEYVSYRCCYCHYWNPARYTYFSKQKSINPLPEK